MKKQTIFLILILFSFFLNSCKYDFILPVQVAPIDTTKVTSFAEKIIPIFADKCTSCHKPGGMGSPDFSNVNTVYSKIVPDLVNTANPESSIIYINAASGNHYAKVSPTQAALILQWIKEGAENN